MAPARPGGVSRDRKFTFSPAKKLSLSFGADLLLLKLAVEVETLQENCGERRRVNV